MTKYLSNCYGPHLQLVRHSLINNEFGFWVRVLLYSILKYHLNKKKLGVKNGELNSSQLHLRHHNNFYTIWELRDLHKRQELNIIHYGLLRRLLGPNSTLAINTNMDVPTTILSLQSFVELKNAMLPKRYLNHGPWIRFLCQWINPHPIPKKCRISIQLITWTFPSNHYIHIHTPILTILHIV